MKSYKVSFFDINLKIDRELVVYAISIKEAETAFNFRNPDYLIFNIIEIN